MVKAKNCRRQELYLCGTEPKVNQSSAVLALTGGGFTLGSGGISA